jgi:hypothetical protein
MKRLVLLSFALLFMYGCATLFPKKTTETKPTTGFGESRASDLVIVAPVDTVFGEWGKPTEVSLDVSWKSGQKYAVQLSPAADTPTWLEIQMQPSIIEPPGKCTVVLKADIEAPGALDPLLITLNASAYGMNTPQPVEFVAHFRRQAGEFAPIAFAPVTVECVGICGKVTGNMVTFYDVLREKNQTCSDADNLPAAQRIGAGFAMTQKGFGFGRTCKTAAVFEPNRRLTFINLGISPLLPRGGKLVSLADADEAWLSADNTVVVARVGEGAWVYEVATGALLAKPCHFPSGSGITTPFLNGATLTAGQCSWEIR